MHACCQTEARELAALRGPQSGVLRAVLVVSVVMFLVEFVAGFRVRSTSLLSDSLDMLGDAFVYAFSLYVLHRSASWRAGAALVKGFLMASFGLFALAEAASRLQVGVVPLAPAMAAFAGLALVANAICFVLLLRHRTDDANLRSTWLCTRNDMAANVAVLGAAALVDRTGSLWPDLLVGVAIAALFLRTAVTVIRESLAELSHREAAVASSRIPTLGPRT